MPEPPTGAERLRHLGPGFLWMVSAAGSGELLFTPRVGAQYRYQLLWALVVAVVLKWFVNREVGRYAVCTGSTVIEGFARLRGPRNWAVWIILVPQLFVAATAIAGLAGSAATAVVLVLPGDVRIWTVVAIACASALVVWGRYGAVERTAIAVATALAIACVAAAVAAGPDVRSAARGLVPSVPAGVDYAEILPWLGFMLSGAAGLIWYSGWVKAKGYGAASSPRPAHELGEQDRARLRGWLRVMAIDCTVAVVGAVVVAVAFLVLGAEVLAPKNLVPDEQKVAAVLGRLLGDMWGPTGFWFMVLGVFAGFWDTVLSDQDGHGRMFATGTRLLLGREVQEETLRRWFVVVLVTVVPVLVYLTVGQPVGLLKIAGAIEAAHIPIVTVLVILLNRRELPEDLRPSRVALAGSAAAGVFFAAFAGVYLVTL